MEDEHRVWPPGPGRRTPPEGTHRGPEEPDEPWNPQLRRTVERDVDRRGVSWESLPPSARFYGAPAVPRRVRRWRGRAGALVALVVASGLVAGLVVVVFRLVGPEPQDGRLVDPLAGVTVTLPPGWREVPVPPVTGFTSVARDSGGALVMARLVPEPVAAPRVAVFEAAELYSRLLLKGDTVSVVEDRALPQGHTRALRAEYHDVVNRPAYLRVTLITREGRHALLVGLLQPADKTSTKTLDTVMASVR